MTDREPFTQWETPTLPGLEHNDDEAALLERRARKRAARQTRREAEAAKELTRRLADW